MSRILRVGLTGGIATGKSTVSRFFAQLGAFVLDADDLAHQVMQPGGSAFDDVVGFFGREILDSQGQIDRKALGKRVFGDAEALGRLNALVHPRVREEMQQLFSRVEAKDKSRVAIFDAALLVETGAYAEFRRLVVTACSRETQLRRLMSRGVLSQADALARIAAQAPTADKVAVADHVIDTECSLEQTRLRTAEVYALLVEELESGR